MSGSLHWHHTGTEGRSWDQDKSYVSDTAHCSFFFLHMNNPFSHPSTYTHTADVNLAGPQIPVMLQLIELIAKDEDHSDSNVASCAGLLGWDSLTCHAYVFCVVGLEVLLPSLLSPFLPTFDSYHHRDLCSSFGKQLLPVLQNNPVIIKLLQEGKRSHTKRTKTLSMWAQKELKMLQQNGWYVHVP